MTGPDDAGGLRPEPRASEGSGFASRALVALGGFLLRLPVFLAASLVLAWAGFIWNLSGRSFAAPAEPLWTWELVTNLAHAPLFGILALLLAALLLRPLVADGWPRFAALPAASVLVLCVLYGAFDEWHQARVPGRDSSSLDLVTDFVGASAVLWIVFYLGRREASERGLWARLLGGACLCFAAAALATLD
jgi:VanZ family protein